MVIPLLCPRSVGKIHLSPGSRWFSGRFLIVLLLPLLAQMVACLPLAQQVRGSIPGGVVNFHLKIFNLGTRRGGDVHFLIARLYITVLD